MDNVPTCQVTKRQPCSKCNCKYMFAGTAVKAKFHDWIEFENSPHVAIDVPITITPLHCAAYFGHQLCIETYCLQNIEIPSMELNNALLLASLEGRSHVIRPLLDAGADIEIKDLNGYSPLMLAIRNDQDETIKILLEAGANINRQSLCIQEQTPLLAAIKKERVDLVAFLLQAGADPNHESQLWKAVLSGSHWIVKVLLEGGADPDYGSPVRVAVKYNDEESLRLLLHHGATVHVLGVMDTNLNERLLQRVGFDRNNPKISQEFSMLILGNHDLGDEGVLMYPEGMLKMLELVLECHVPVATATTWCKDKGWLLKTAICGGDHHKLSQVMDMLDAEDSLNLDGALLQRFTNTDICDPAVIDVLLKRGAHPDLTDDPQDRSRMCFLLRGETPLFRILDLTSKQPPALHILVNLLRFNCCLDGILTRRMRKRNWIYYEAAQITALDYALLTFDLFSAQMIVDSGYKTYNSSINDTDMEPVPLACTIEERNDFISENLESPSSLKLSCRKFIRNRLGKDTKSKIDQLPLKKFMKRFLDFNDLEKIAQTFQEKMSNFYICN